jgi:hypothetical protein
MRRHLILVSLVFALPAISADGENVDFDRVVRDAERHFGTSRARIPFLGVATFITGAARPFGASGFRLALFEDVDADQPFTPKLSAAWRPVVRVRESSGEGVTIYGRDEGHWIHLLMINQDGGGAVLAQFRLRPSRFLEFVARKAREH